MVESFPRNILSQERGLLDAVIILWSQAAARYEPAVDLPWDALCNFVFFNVMESGNGTEDIVKALAPRIEESKIQTPFCSGIMQQVRSNACFICGLIYSLVVEETGRGEGGGGNEGSSRGRYAVLDDRYYHET